MGEKACKIVAFNYKNIINLQYYFLSHKYLLCPWIIYMISSYFTFWFFLLWPLPIISHKEICMQESYKQSLQAAGTPS